MSYSIQEQIRCVEREIKYRQWVYPNRVLSGKMTIGTKDKEIALMQAVYQTLVHYEHLHLDKPWNNKNMENNNEK